MINRMKRIYCNTCMFTMMFLALSIAALAQNEPRVKNANDETETLLPEEKGFKKENLFTGGNVTLSFSSGYTVLGASPMIGYKLNDYVDAGAVVNYIFTGARDYLEFNDKIRQHTYGSGVFLRAYPVSFLYAQVQPEYNFMTQRYSSANGSIKNTVTTSAPSLLVGGGYAGGRAKGGTTFYYMSILVDVLQRQYSPYVDVDYHADGSVRRVRMQPIIRAGFNIGLFQKRYQQY